METRNPNVRSNNDSHQRFEQDGSQPQRSRQRLTQTKQSPPRVPVDTFIFSYCRGPRVIRNRRVAATTTTSVRQAAAAADSEITTITRITIKRVYFTTRNCTVVCFTNAKKSQHNIKLRVRTSTTCTSMETSLDTSEPAMRRCTICKGVLRIYFLYYARARGWGTDPPPQRHVGGGHPPQRHAIWHKQCISHSRINNNYSVQH
mmetsp:Transcript_22005/g.44989  ORF Transcript_22005/g.44989 Transcript_22005/m.44989 type:complete len:203 (+) Transcript_22005:283-891(+)